MKNLKIKSHCKVNLSLNIIKKLKNGYHNINSLITFCKLHDVITISKIKDTKDKISFSGQFKKGINKKSNTITKTLNLLRKSNFFKKQRFKINVHKNIPHGSGLGGGSSNAAALLNFFNIKMGLKMKKSKIKMIAKNIGFDTPICLKKKNTLLTGRKDEILRLNKKFSLNIILLYPNLNCSTKKIYQKHIIEKQNKFHLFFNKKGKKELINYLLKQNNDLQKTVFKLYPKIKGIISFVNSQKGCHFSRISGSGSSCIGIFSNKKNLAKAQKLIKIKYPNFWCVASKTI